MRVILHKITHPHQSVQRSGRLVAMAGTKFGQAQRQIPVGFKAMVVDLDMRRAVHRLDRIVPVLGGRGEHQILELLPVTRLLPQGAVNNLRGAHLLIAMITQLSADIVLDGQVDLPAPVVPEDHPRRLFL